MGKELKVLMMGGQRVGKSSALAAIMNAFTCGCAASLFKAKDTTILQKIDGERQASVEQCLKDAKDWLCQNEGRIVLSDSGKTNIRWDYTLELTLNDTNDMMRLTFTDINGEWFELNNPNTQEVRGLVAEYDVFVVAVDSTFLMEARNPDNSFVTRSKNEKHNCTQQIHYMLTEINDSDGRDAKLVIFVPIKCEYWARNGQIDEVSRAVATDYHTAITGLLHRKSVQVEILPIQTLGCVFYHSHTEPFIFNYKERKFVFFKVGKNQRCAELEDGTVRLADGTIRSASEGSIEDDPQALMIAGSTIMRPHTWFSVESKAYSPYNCEQIAFHILEFMLAKRIDIEIRSKEEENGIVKGLKKMVNFIFNASTLGLWNELRDIFGGISCEQMKGAIEKLNALGLIRHSGDGITIVKKCNFKTL